MCELAITCIPLYSIFNLEWCRVSRVRIVCALVEPEVSFKGEQASPQLLCILAFNKLLHLLTSNRLVLSLDGRPL
jgi:hypothetical protein